MNSAEFAAWLEGYVEAGGKDVERILERAREVKEVPPVRFDPVCPIVPTDAPTVVPFITPSFPINPAQPTFDPYPWQPVPPVWCTA